MNMHILEYLTAASFALSFSTLTLVACGDDSSLAPTNEDQVGSVSSSSSLTGSSDSSASETTPNICALFPEMCFSSSSVIHGGSPASSSTIANEDLGSKPIWQSLNSAKTYGAFTDSRDGQVYKTIQIGSQVWMAENLNYDMGNVSGMSKYAWNGCYNDKLDSCAKYGRLYTWEVAMNNADCAYDKKCNPSGTIRGVCPVGWHLPSNEEWRNLVEPMATSIEANTTDWFYRYYYGVGVKLKSTNGWFYHADSTIGNNASGFSALPAGYRNARGDFYRADSTVNFWSISENNDYYAYCLFLGYNSDGSRLDIDNKGFAYSVRCIKD